MTKTKQKQRAFRWAMLVLSIGWDNAIRYVLTQDQTNGR